MATLTIVNVTSPAVPVLIQDLYTTIPASGTITTTRAMSDLPRMTSLQNAINLGKVTLSVALSADEAGSGLAIDGAAPVAVASIESGLMLLRIQLAAGAGGAPDDTTVFAVADMPANYRIVDCVMYVLTAVGASTVQIRSTTGGAGTLYLSLSGAATGVVRMPAATTAPPVATRSASNGLIVRRSDTGIAMELLLYCRPEL